MIFEISGIKKCYLFIRGIFYAEIFIDGQGRTERGI